MIEGFILAGGKSSRMGVDKFNLQIDGKTFLERAVETLKPVCENVKIVLNQKQIIETNQLIICDIYIERGALGGIHTALKTCETKFAIILAVDLPFVTTEAIENLTSYALASNKYLAVVPRQNDGRLQPLCAIYRANYCLPILEKLLDETESASVRDFLELIYPKYVDANLISSSENLLFNVNSPDDFDQIGLVLTDI